MTSTITIFEAEFTGKEELDRIVAQFSSDVKTIFCARSHASAT
jgi:hypothetical protein